MSASRAEVLVNVMWRELDMAIRGAAKRETEGKSALLQCIFDGQDWRAIAEAGNIDMRAEKAMEVYKEMIGAQWSTNIHMLEKNRTRHFLLHLSNHPDGRTLMKECLWKICPTGVFAVPKWDNPSQTYLLSEEPNLEPLKAWIRTQLAEPRAWESLNKSLVSEIWLHKHTKKALSQMRSNGEIRVEEGKRFSKSANPILSLKAERRKPKRII